jgi:nucleotidyltransferase substrate binding protein (TIGR01987 family)
MLLDLSPLAKAISQLETSLAYTESGLHGQKDDPMVTQLFRLATIHTFTCTYELAVKMIRRYLSLTYDSPDQVENMTFYDLIRTAFELGLIKQEVLVWKGFRQNRGTTSHAYDVSKASDVYAQIPAFLYEVKFLLAVLDLRLKDLQIKLEDE